MYVQFTPCVQEVERSHSIFKKDMLHENDRISLSQVFKKSAFRNFVEITGKNLYHCSPATLQKRLRHRCFPVNFAQFSRAAFCTTYSGGCSKKAP